MTPRTDAEAYRDGYEERAKEDATYWHAERKRIEAEAALRDAVPVDAERIAVVLAGERAAARLPLETEITRLRAALANCGLAAQSGAQLMSSRRRGGWEKHRYIAETAHAALEGSKS